jgi:uncharacterized Zn ribbon protein
MKLGEALFCVNCENIFSFRDTTNMVCPECCSNVTVYLNKWLKSTKEIESELVSIQKLIGVY